MTLAIFLALGDSFTDMKKTGQDTQFKNFYLLPYSAAFKKIYIFSYEKEKIQGLPKNVDLIDNSINLHRYIYALMMPFIHRKMIRSCDMVRAYHVTGAVPAIITKLIYNKPFIFNYAYNYKKFASIDRKFVQLFLLTLIEPLAFLFADKIFISSKLYLRKSKKLVYLPNGVNTKHFKPAASSKHNSRTTKILSVGRLTAQKNFQTLIKSLKGLNTTLTIIGTGPLKNSLKYEARKQNVNLTIIDHFPNKDMPKIYNSADIFILPSLIEGHPKALLEAMSCAMPVVCTDVAGSNEIVKDNFNGLVIKPSESNIRSALEKLISNPKLRSRLSKRARKDIISNFDLSNLIENEMSGVKSLI